MLASFKVHILLSGPSQTWSDQLEREGMAHVPHECVCVWSLHICDMCTWECRNTCLRSGDQRLAPAIFFNPFARYVFKQGLH